MEGNKRKSEKTKKTRRWWLWTGAIGSVLVVEGVDKFFFVIIATLFGIFPVALMLSLIILFPYLDAYSKLNFFSVKSLMQASTTPAS